MYPTNHRSLIRRYYADITRAERLLLAARYPDARRLANRLILSLRRDPVPFRVYRDVYDRVILRVESLGY